VALPLLVDDEVVVEVEVGDTDDAFCEPQLDPE